MPYLNFKAQWRHHEENILMLQRQT